MNGLYDLFKERTFQLRLLMVSTYVLSFAFFVLAVIDFIFSLSPTVMTITFLSSGGENSVYSFGYVAYYLITYAILWTTHGFSSDILDKLEKDRVGLSKIVIIE